MEEEEPAATESRPQRPVQSTAAPVETTGQRVAEGGAMELPEGTAMRMLERTEREGAAESMVEGAPMAMMEEPARPSSMSAPPPPGALGRPAQRRAAVQAVPEVGRTLRRGGAIQMIRGGATQSTGEPMA